MEERKIQIYLDTVNKWTYFNMLLLYPIFLFALTKLPFLMIGALKYFYRTDEAIGRFYIDALEFRISLDSRIGTLMFCLSYIVVIHIVLMRKKNKIQCVYKINLLLLLYSPIAYYQYFITFQLLISDTGLKLVAWIIFPMPLIAIVYLYLTKKEDYLSKVREKIIKHIFRFGIPSSLIYISCKYLFAEVRQVETEIIGRLFFLLPIVWCIAFSFLLPSCLETVLFFKKVNENQEEYRKNMGYSTKEWYGEKSKMR